MRPMPRESRLDEQARVEFGAQLIVEVPALRRLDQGRDESLINTVRGRGYAVWTT